MAASRELKIKVLGNAQNAVKALDKVDSRSSKLKGALAKFGKAAAGGVTAAGTALFAMGDSFDQAYDKIVVGTGATGKQLDGLKQSFKNVVNEVPADFGVAAQAMANLQTMTGATGTTLEDLSVSVLEASRLLGEDATRNSQLFGKAMNQFGVEASEGSAKLDSLFAVTQKYGIGLDALTGQLTEYGSVMLNAGFNMEETAVVFGQLNKAGLSVSRLMPGLNKAFRTWADEGKNSRVELTNVITKMREAKTDTEALSIAAQTFGAEGAQRMTTAVRSGALSLEDLTAALDGSQGSIAATAKETDSFREKWELVKNKVFVALEPLATKLFDAIAQGMDAIGPIVKRIQEGFEQFRSMFIKSNGEMGTSIKDFQKTVKEKIKQAREVFDNIRQFVLQKFIPAILKIYKDAKPTFDKILKTVTVVMNGIEEIITTIWKKIVKLWDRYGSDILKFAKEIWDNIKQVIDGAMDVIQGVIETVTGIITGDWERAWNGIKQIFSGVWKAIKGILDTAWEAVKAVIRTGIEFVQRKLESKWNEIKAKVSAIWTAIKGLISDAIANVKGTISDAMNAVRRTWAGGWSKIKRVVSGSWDTIKGIVGGAIESIKRKIEGLFRKVRAIPGKIRGAIGSAVKNLPGASLLSKIPGLAHGGTVTKKGLTLVGEQGPELLKLPRGASVIPLDKATANVGGGGSVHHHYNIQVAGTAAPMKERDLFSVMRRVELLHG